MTPPPGDEASFSNDAPPSSLESNGEKKIEPFVAIDAKMLNGQKVRMVSNDNDEKNGANDGHAADAKKTSLVEMNSTAHADNNSPNGNDNAISRGGDASAGLSSKVMQNNKKTDDSHQQQSRVEGYAKNAKSASSASNENRDSTTNANQGEKQSKQARSAQQASGGVLATQPSAKAVAGAAAAKSANLNKKEQQILASIQHRRKLLTWVRESRIESQRVRNQYAKGDRQGFVASILNNDHGANNNASQQNQQNGQGGSWPSTANASSGASEIADFQAITSMANKPSSLLKRTKSGGMDNASRDLRRNASVGKRMTNACSALNNNGGWISTTSSSDTISLGSQQQKQKEPGSSGGGPMHPSNPPKVISSPAADGAIPAASAHPASNMEHPSTNPYPGKQFQGKQFQGKQFHKPAPAKIMQQGGAMPHPVPSSSHAPKPAAEKQKKARKRANSLKKSVVGSGGNIDGDGIITLPGGMLAPPKHHANNLTLGPGVLKTGVLKAASIKAPNNVKPMMLHPMQALVPSAAAVKLLERRDGLVSRLSNLLRRRCRVSGKHQPPLESKLKDVSGILPLLPTKVAPADGANDKPKEGSGSLPLPTKPGPKEGTNNKPKEGSGSLTTLEPDLKEGISRALLPFSPGQTSAFASPAIYGKSKKGITEAQHISTVPTPKIASPSIHSKQQPPTSLQFQPPPPAQRLPPRRKTQWDCVLEEMRWMATDFCEERKWKVAAGKTLSGAIKQHRPKKKSSSSLMGSPMRRTPSSSLRSRSSTPKSIGSSFSSKGQVCIQNDTDPLYVDASKDDLEKAKKISQLLSVSILDHWESTDADMGYERFQKLRAGVASLDDSEHATKSLESNQLDECSLESSDKDESIDTISPKFTELSYDEISSRIEASIEFVNALKEQASIIFEKENAQKAPKETTQSTCCKMQVELGRGQLQTVHFVEKLWQSSCVRNCDIEGECSCLQSSEGNSNQMKLPLNNDTTRMVSAIVGGSLGVGKTVSVCALLWKLRRNGPQLIVCSPCALLRWRHELKKYDGFNVQIFDRKPLVAYGESVIVVCDYESFLELDSGQHDFSSGKGDESVRSSADNEDRDTTNFASLILDFRHPSSSSHQRLLVDGEKQLPKITLLPIESVKWWIFLNNFIFKRSSNMKRLVIEQSDLPQNCLISPIHLDDNSKGKRYDEMLAMKLAFIYHPSIFFSEQASIGKRIISWARRQAKKPRMGNGESIGLTTLLCNSDNVQSLQGYRSVLSASLQCVHDSMPVCMDSNVENESNTGSEAKEALKNQAWELCMCSLARPQQSEYDDYCDDVEGSDKEIADSLMKLRKICVHSHLDEIVTSLMNPMRRFRAFHGSSLVRNSASLSEPNIDVAKKIVKKSSKMKELLRLLIGECGYYAAKRFDLVENPINDNRSRPEAPKKRAKVLILATLVEAQIFTSLFLSAVGLHHEVLVSNFTKQNVARPSSHGSKITSLMDSPVENTSAWAWGQDILSQFNSGVDMENTHFNRSVGILIASPKTISSHCGGIGAASADMVVSIDEDWSGREAFHVTSILAKIRQHELGTVNTAPLSSSERCKFIKLVCKNTCEEAFLCKGNMMNADGTDPEGENKRDAHNKLGKVVTRRSSRQSARAASKTSQEEPPKTNSDMTEADGESNNAPTSVTKPQKRMFLRPNKLEPDKTLISGSGFLIPTTIDGYLQTHNNSNDHHVIIGSNIVRYRNCKLSSVLFGPWMGTNSNEVFMPTKVRRSNRAAAAEFDAEFVQALFNAEDDALMISSTEPTNHLHGSEFGPWPTALAHVTSPSVASRSYVHCFVESFRRTPSFISQRRSKKQMYLMDQNSKPKAGRGVASIGDSSGSNAESSTKDLCRNKAKSGNHSSTLLVYKLPHHASRKRKISDAGLAIERENEQKNCLASSTPHGKLAQSIFSFCFSSFNSSKSALDRDRNQGCEPLVYFPSFLPSLLQLSENGMHAIPQENAFSGVKRKYSEGQFSNSESKRFRLSTPHEVVLSSGSAPRPFSAISAASNPDLPLSSWKMGIALPTDSNDNDTFSVSIETNPYSFRDEKHEFRNAELIFHRRLLSADPREAFSCQSQESLKSMILITQKKQQPNVSANLPRGSIEPVPPPDSIQKIPNHVGTGKKSLHKKIKRQHQHLNTSPTRDKCSTSYFRTDHLLSQSYSARGGEKADFMASLIGQVRLQCRLNDLVSSSFTVSLTDSNQPQVDQVTQQNQLSVPFSIQRNNRLILRGEIPRIDAEFLHVEQRIQSGITLPVGVKAPQLAKKLPSSLKETSESWTDAEDSVLRESLSRYGMNWHLAAHAVSSGMMFTPTLIAAVADFSGNLCKRSPTQCEHRWMSIKKENKIQIDSFFSPKIEFEVPASTAKPHFAIEVGSGRKNIVMLDESFSINQLKQEPNKKYKLQWIEGHIPTSAEIRVKKAQPLSSRIKKLKDVSKKTRVANVPIPGSMPTHASHSESIQTARASMLAAANGIAPPRQEMWPLELLDYVKKNKATANQPTQRDTPRSASNSAHPPTQSSHCQQSAVKRQQNSIPRQNSVPRQQNPVPYHPPRNIHPTQHQMYHGAGQIPNQHPPYQGHIHHTGVNPTVAYQAPQPRIPRHHQRPKEQKKGST